MNVNKICESIRNIEEDIIYNEKSLEFLKKLIQVSKILNTRPSNYEEYDKKTMLNALKMYRQQSRLQEYNEKKQDIIKNIKALRPINDFIITNGLF